MRRRPHRPGPAWLAGVVAFGALAVLGVTSAPAVPPGQSPAAAASSVAEPAVAAPADAEPAVAAPAVAAPAVEQAAQALVDEDTHPAVLEDAYARGESVPVTNPPKAKSKLRVLVVPVYWSGNPRDSMTTAQLKSIAITWTDRYFREMSRGRLGVTGTVVPWTKISSSGMGCTGLEAALDNRAIAAAKAHGYTASKYDRLLVYHPFCGDYSWAGRAELGSSRGPGRHLVINGSASLSTYVHELSHTFGLNHANSYACKSGSTRVTLSSTCKASEYDDAFDVMGMYPSGGSLSTPHLAQLGWLTKKQTKAVTKSVSNVRLTPLVGSSSGIKTIRVRASATRTYWVELRVHKGVDGRLSPGGVGVQVRMTDSRLASASGGRTVLLDLQPQNSWTSVTLPAASAWTSPEGVRISVSSVSTTSATVSVRYKAPKPKVPSRPTVTATRGDTTARVTVKRPAGNGSVVQSYTVKAVPAGGGTTVTKKVDAKAAASSSATLTGLKNGKTYAITVKARNEKGSSSSSKTVKVTPAPLAPVVTLTSPAAGATVKGLSLTVKGTVARQSGSSAIVDLVEVEAWQDGGPNGDAKYLYGAWTSKHAFSATLDLTWVQDGPVVLTVTASDSNGRVRKVTRTFTVAGHAPTVAFGSTPAVGTVADGFDLTYTASARSPATLSMQLTLPTEPEWGWVDRWQVATGTRVTRHVDVTGLHPEPGDYVFSLEIVDEWGGYTTLDVPVRLT